MYAASSSTRIYRSADGGATWSQLGTGITAGTIISKIRTPSSTTLWAVTTAGVLFRSANSGVSFGQVNTVLTPNIQDLEANGNLVYVISNNRLQYSNDNGATFVTSSSFTGSLANTSLFAYSVALNPTTNRAFVLYSDGPHTSTNGTAWSSIKGGIADASFQGTLELDPGQNLYMTNLMTNVRRVYSGNALGVWNSSTGVLLRPEQQVTCFLPRTATEWILGTQHYGVYRTVDGGSSWTEANSGLKLVSATGIFYTQQNRILLAVGGVGYYESIDEGSTWTIRTSAPLPQGTVRGFVRLSDGSVLAYGSGVFRSTGPTIGNAWTQQSTQALSQIVTFDGINLFGFVGNQLFTSTNQGVTWTLRSVPAITTFINKIQVGHNNDLFISTSNSLFRLPVASTIATVIRGLTSDFTVFASTGNTTIYLLANINTLETSLDGGATWSSRSIISTSANRIWAFRNNVLVMQSPNTSNFFYSRDGGANWTITPLADAEARATDVVLSGSELAYIATANSVAYKSQALIIPPTAPTGLVSVGVSSNQIQVLFNDNSSSESVFELEVSVGNNTNFQVNQRSSAFNTFQQKGRFVVSALAPGTSH
nr:hypothetical protein [Cyclobacteriaceae bacterium]